VASECPSIEGRYKNDSDPTLGSFPIFKRADGTLVLGANKPTDKDLPVTGEPTGDPHVGQQTAICQDGQIQIESNDKKDGHLRATLTPVGNNLSLYVKDDNGFNFTRTLRRL